MTGHKKYYKIPLLTRFFRIKFYLYWRDDKFYKMGFERDTMTFEQALKRLERKRLYRESIDKL
jgi:hypothetical protein